MPKRARETEETQDAAWIGRAVMLTPAAARGKRLPEAIVMKILRVTQGVGASKVLVEYSSHGLMGDGATMISLVAFALTRWAL